MSKFKKWLVPLIGMALLTTVYTASAFTLRAWKWPAESTTYKIDSTYTNSGTGWNSRLSSAISGWALTGFSYTQNSSSVNVIKAGSHPQCGAGCAAYTSNWITGGTTTKFEIVVNTVSGIAFYDGTQGPSIPSNYYDLGTIMRHELGHALGLCHSAAPNSRLMSTILAVATIKSVDTDATNGENNKYNGQTNTSDGACIP